MSQPFDLAIDVTTRTITLRSKHLSARSPWSAAREFIGRLLSTFAVGSITVDRRSGTATLELRTANSTMDSLDGPAHVRLIASAVRRPAPQGTLPGDAYAELPIVCFQKVGGGITAGAVVSQLPGRIRIRHPLLKGQRAAVSRLQRELGAIPDVQAVCASSVTGSVLVLYRQGVVTSSQLVLGVERILGNGPSRELILAGPAVTHWVAAGTCLALAVTSEFFVPAAATLTAIALVSANLPTLGRGIVELCTFNWRISSLYTVIMGTTLVSGQFLAAALMQASVTAWHGWTTHRLRKFIRNIEAGETRTPRLSEQPTAPATIRSQPIEPGTVLHVPAGSILPFDGIVVSGEGELDEHGLRGTQGLIHCGPNDLVFAGSTVTQGPLMVEVVAIGPNTRLALVRRALHGLVCESVGEGGATPRGKAIAGRFVPFTFATGTAALLAGDITTLAAVLRPDFCTGPSLNDRLGALTGASHLLHRGWVIRSSAAFHALAQTKVVVMIHDDSEQDRGSAETACCPQVSFSELDCCFTSVQLHEVHGSTQQGLDYVHHLAEARGHVAVVASHTILQRVCDENIIRISLTPEDCLEQDSADVVAMHGSPHRLADLLTIVHQAVQPGRTAWSVALTVNALSISGAFLVGLTSLHVVVLTNLGALSASILYQRLMKRSDRLVATHSVRRITSSHELFAHVGSSDEAARTPEWGAREHSNEMPVVAGVQPIEPRKHKRNAHARIRPDPENQDPFDESLDDMTQDEKVTV